jgi:predicted dehydrogenase
MKITPFIAGSGMAGKGMAKALGIIGVINPDFQIAPYVQLKRDQTLHGLTKGVENPLLMIANPHGYHAEMILEGEKAGFNWMICDKPVCISKTDIPKLQNVKSHVAVTHGFRQNWGPQMIKKMMDAGEFGEIISIEGRYWQCSAAVAALSGENSTKDWKNDKKLNGDYDALVDLGAHYTDLMCFFADGKPLEARKWVSHVNAPAAHRDTHAHVEFIFPKFRARGSISKTAHGTGNDLEITILGAKQSATWHVERPDEVKISKGSTTTMLQKPNDSFGSRQPPFHGMGWIEGYIDITHSFLMHMAGHPTRYPTLAESLRVMEVLL